MSGVVPSARAASATAYRRSPSAPAAALGKGLGASGESAENVLRLDANEGPFSLTQRRWIEIPEARRASIVREYPDPDSLRVQLADHLGVGAERVVVTAGGDDALMRLCLATIDPGCHAVSTTPTFEMIPRYVSLAGGILRQVPWTDGPFPVESFTRMIDGQTRAVFIVTPNNPTGLAATAGDLAAVANAAPHALMVVDLAYTEFAGEDLTPVAISLPNAVAVRTLSKAWGLAGLRVGYAVGDPTVIDWLRAVGQPYAVAGPSAAIASWAIRDLKDAVLAGVDRVREERGLLAEMLRHKGLRVNDSLANFVLARSPRARGIAGSLATHGIAVRAFPGRPGLEDGLRITCPGEAELFSRLVKALENST